MINTVIFDIGNVLMDVDFIRSIRQYTNTDEEANRCYMAFSKDHTWDLLDKGTYTNEEVMKRFVKNDPEMEPYMRDFFDGMEQLLKPFDFADAWIESVKADKKKVYILSNWPQFVHKKFEKEMGFLEKVDGYMLSYLEKLVKPDYAYYNLLLERYQLDPTNCVFIDDRKENIIAAQEVGMKGILFETKEQVENDLKAFGVNIKS